jgi:hypothetical protein
MLHNGNVYVRPLKHFASRRLRQTISSAQTGHQLLLGTARERSPSSTRSKAVLSLLLALILSASMLRASPLVMVNQLPAVGSHVTSLTSMGVAFSKAAFGVDAFALLVNGVPATSHYYRLMIEHVRKVLDDVKRVYPGYDAAQGYELGGFVWLQGFNDMVDGHVYPNHNKTNRFDLYSKLLAHFIRDVRMDLAALNLPFVIGVMGVGGPKDESVDSQTQ